MHHADSGRDSVPGVVHFNGLAIDKDLAGSRFEQAVKLVHQRGFSRAVLAQDCVDLTLMNRQVYAVVCHKIAESLDDIAHLDDRGFHVYILF